MENIGICLPQPGYLEAVREITRSYGTMLIFDEVKTGITAGWGGATGAVGVQPDLVALAKSIGGGLPLGAFGGTPECMDQITSGKVLHLGTYNGNPLCMAAAKAVLAEVCTPEAHARRPSTATAVVLDACQNDHRPTPASRRTPCSSARRAASRGRRRRSATTATTRPPTSTSPSRSGCTASTVACCCRRASTSSG